MEELVGVSRRLPVYFLLDISGSMMGQPIESVRQGVKAVINDLKTEPQAMETAYISIITFGSEARQIIPLTDILSFQEPNLDVSGTTSLGAALSILDNCLENEVKKSTSTQKGDYKPLVILMTDGEPTDNWEGPANIIKSKSGKFANILAVGCGPQVNDATLKKISEVSLKMESIQPNDFKQFFKWISTSIKGASKSLTQDATASIDLGAPPAGIVLVP
jgi:uncharacterized protein YegL